MQIDWAIGEGGGGGKVMQVVLVVAVKFKQNELSARLNESCEFH